MKNKLRFLTAALAVMICLCGFSTVAFAYTDETEETEAVAETEETTETESEANPLTPDGTGTVLDNASSEAGKEFFTIITEDENVFYLIIDRQKDTNNVYFLNAVTERDLLALAEKSEDTDTSGSTAVTAKSDTAVETTTEPEADDTASGTETQEKSNSSVFLIIFAVLIVGGVGYYFKIYRPKHQALDLDDEFDEDEEMEYEDEAQDEYGGYEEDTGEYGAEDLSYDGEEEYIDTGEDETDEEML